MFKAVFHSKITTILAALAAVIGVLTKPEFAGFLPQDISAVLMTVGAVIGFLSRGLLDTDGDGRPDIIDPD